MFKHCILKVILYLLVCRDIGSFDLLKNFFDICSNRLLHNNCGAAFLQGKMIYFAEDLVGRQLNDLDKAIDITSYFTKLRQFALQNSSAAVTVKG